jgi:DNA-directed RNA polymerase specialized sigma24 family protein
MTQPGDRVDLMAPLPEDPRNRANLLAWAREGDATAWEGLIRRYNDLVRSTVSSFRLQEDDADEAVPNTWLRVLERMDTIRDPELLGGWLATTATRECLTLIRRREVPEKVAGKQPVTTLGEPTRRREMLIQHLFYQPAQLYYGAARAAGMSPGSIGTTPRQALQQLRENLKQRGADLQPRADLTQDVKGEPTEGDRTGSHLLDDLLDKADQALRERLEPKVTDFRTGSTQGTGDAQLDDLLQRADAALRAALHDQATTNLATEDDNRDSHITVPLTDRSQEHTRSRAPSDTITHKVGDADDALPGRGEQSLESEPSELDEARRRSARPGGMQEAGRPLGSASTTPSVSGDCPAPVHEDITIEQRLTRQELGVALAVLRGLSNADAAAALLLSVKTIEYHLSCIYRKLGINSRTQLIRILSEGD